MIAPKKPSYAAVHYLLRPAKNIQRKMLCQLFHRLNRFHRVDEYRYIGFGSVYFGDFVLFHRALGISRMTTIEGNTDDVERFRFNAPFKCVDFLFGHSSKKLSEVPWHESAAIVWLDYDYGLEESVLFDAMLTVRRAAGLSVFLVTLDAEQKALAKPYFSNGDDIADLPDGIEFCDLPAREQLAAKIKTSNAAFLPDNVDLRGEGLAEAYRQTLMNAVERALAERNAANPSGEPRLKLVQLVNFRYADGREMMTWGGILVPEDHELATDLETTEIGTIDFARTGAEAFEIEAPKLTFKEIREMNSYMPATDPSEIKVPISEADKRAFMKVYRYFPSFTEAEI